MGDVHHYQALHQGNPLLEVNVPKAAFSNRISLAKTTKRRFYRKTLLARLFKSLPIRPRQGNYWQIYHPQTPKAPVRERDTGVAVSQYPQIKIIYVFSTAKYSCNSQDNPNQVP